jgi:hypothetical protein
MRPMPGLRVSHPAFRWHASRMPGSTIASRGVCEVVECVAPRVDLCEHQILRIRWRERPRTHVLLMRVAGVCTGVEVRRAHATAKVSHGLRSRIHRAVASDRR